MTVAVAGAAYRLLGGNGGGRFLFGVSETPQAYTVDRARRSLKSLTGGQGSCCPPGRKEGSARRRGGDRGHHAVKPGEKLAMDGGGCRRSPSTGPRSRESVPVPVEPGGEVFAGSIKGRRFGSRVTAGGGYHPGPDHARWRAQERAPTQAFVDRFAVLHAGVILWPSAWR